MGQADREGRKGRKVGPDHSEGEGELREGSNPISVEHRADSSFWDDYNDLPEKIQKTADRKLDLLKESKNYPSLKFKPVGETSAGKLYSARATKKNTEPSPYESPPVFTRGFSSGPTKNTKG